MAIIPVESREELWALITLFLRLETPEDPLLSLEGLSVT